MNNDGAAILSNGSANGKAARDVSEFSGRKIRNYVGWGGMDRWMYHPALRRGRFNRWDAWAMLQDNSCAMGLLALMSPWPSVSYEVKANSPKIKRFIENTIHRFWTHDLQKVLLHYLPHGTFVGEVLYDWDEDEGYWKYAGLDDFRLDEVQLLRRGRVLTGARVTSGGAGMIGLPTYDEMNPQDGQRPPNELRPPKLFVCAHKALCGALFGRSVFEAAWDPWMEKVGAHGALDVRKLWAFTAAFRGAIIVYPPGGNLINGVYVDNQDVAREIGERYSTGASMTMPFEPDEKGNNMWEIKDPTMNGDIKGLLEYPSALSEEIWQGMDVPPEAIRSLDAQGWGNAKGVPMLLLLNGCDLKIREVMTAFDVGPGGYTSRAEQSGGVVRPLVMENFGPKARYEIKVFPLVPKAQPPGATGPGGPPGAPPSPGGAPPGAPAPIPGAGSAPIPGVSGKAIGLSQASAGDVEVSNDLVSKILGRELPSCLSQAEVDAPVALAAAFDESKHHRGQPGNAGEFGPGGGNARAAPAPQAAAQKPHQSVFAKATEADAFANANVKSAALSQGGQAAVAAYRKSAAVYQINNFLRDRKSWKQKIVGLGAQNKQTIAQLDQVIAHSKTEAPMTVMRGFRLNPGDKPAAEMFKPGSVFSDGAYVSTTLASEVAERFSATSTYGAERVVVSIDVPQGSNAYHMPRVQGEFDEAELLLPRGAKFQVQSVEKDKDGLTHVKVKYLNQQAPQPAEGATSLSAAAPAQGHDQQSSDRFVWKPQHLTWDESKHNRGQPGNSGEFSSKATVAKVPVETVEAGSGGMSPEAAAQMRASQQRAKEAADAKRPVARAKVALAKMGTNFQEVMDRVPGAKWMREKVVAINKGLANRYGVKQAALIVASGQAFGWGLMPLGVATVGVPLYVPFSTVAGMIPGAALAELHYQLVGKHKAKPAVAMSAAEPEQLTQEQINELGKKLVKKLMKLWKDRESDPSFRADGPAASLSGAYDVADEARDASGEWTGGDGTAPTYEQADRLRQKAEAACKEAATALNAIPGFGSAGMGLTPDHVKATPAYRQARAASASAFAKLQKINAWIAKTFKREEANARKLRQAARQKAADERQRAATSLSAAQHANLPEALRLPVKAARVACKGACDAADGSHEQKMASAILGAEGPGKGMPAASLVYLALSQGDDPLAVLRSVKTAVTAAMARRKGAA
jgi:hypothetical protein